MLRRLISSHLKTLTTISSTPQFPFPLANVLARTSPPSPTTVAATFATTAAALSLLSHHLSTQTVADTIKKKVEDVMPTATGHECKELQAELKAIARASVLNDALKSIYNAEERGERQVMIRPASKVIIGFLSVMQKHGYIGAFTCVDDHHKTVVELNGRLNKWGVISPRFNVGVKEIEGLTAKLLPSGQLGYIVLTTSVGIMDHEEARRKNVGGKVIGFFY